MIDSHCHLDHCADPDDAADPALRAIVTVGTTLERSRRSVALAERHPNVWAAVGIHPNEASDAADPEVRAGIAALAEHPRVVAIGETGVDTYWDRQPLEAQIDAFAWQAELAAGSDLALILHVRDPQGRDDASREAARLLRDTRHGRGVLHCFNGHPELLAAGLELGWMVSFAGNLTYKNATELHEAARVVPPERLMVETDSPFLTPVPKRGQRNVPANVRFTAAFLAELRGLEPERLVPVLDANAARLYGLPVG